MSISGGFGFTFDIKRAAFRRWVIGQDGVKRWADSGEPVENTQSDEMIDGDD